MNHSVAILIGSNSSDREDRIRLAAASVRHILGPGSSMSEITDTPDFSGIGADYLNIVITAQTSLDRECLSSNFEAIEARMGRDRKNRHTVTVDIDIVIFDGHIIKPKEFSSEAFQRGYSQIAGQMESGIPE